MVEEEVLQEPEVRDILRTALELEGQHAGDTSWLGMQWFDLSAAPQTLNMLVRAKLLRVSYKSNNATHYRVVDTEKLRRLLESTEEEAVEQEEEAVEIPHDIFDVITLHQDKKQLLMKAITAQSPVHVLLVGEIGTAKTVFLQELARLPSSEYVLGSRLSSAGLYEVMFNNRPRYLILDELDKVETQENIAALLSLMETGILSEMKWRRRRQATFRTWVFASCNYENRIPPEILSRFGAYKLRFRAYTPEEYLEVTTNVLIRREGVEPNLARYIAEQTLLKLDSRDVRDARSIARTARTRKEVDDVLALIVKQGGERDRKG